MVNGYISDLKDIVETFKTVKESHCTRKERIAIEKNKGYYQKIFENAANKLLTSPYALKLAAERKFPEKSQGRKDLVDIINKIEKKQRNNQDFSNEIKIGIDFLNKFGLYKRDNFEILYVANKLKELEKGYNLLRKKKKSTKPIKDLLNKDIAELKQDLDSFWETYKTYDIWSKKLACTCLPWVVEIAKKYYRPNLNFSDLVESGSIGLMRAVKRFDAARECRFSTYATNWIKQHIYFGTHTSNFIKIPSYILENIQKKERLISKSGNSDINFLAKKLKRTLPTIEKLARCQSLLEIQSLDFIIDENDRSILQEIESPDENYPYSFNLKREQISSLVNRLLLTISKREREIIQEKYGITEESANGNNTVKTLRELSQKYDISRERVRQIVERGILKLRKTAQSFNKYEDYRFPELLKA